MKTKRYAIPIVLLLVCALAVAQPLIAAADTRSELNSAIQQRNAVASQLYTIQDRINILESKKGEALEYLSELNNQLNQLNAELSDIQMQYRDKQLELDTVMRDLEDASKEEERQRGDMSVRIQYMYENSTDAGLLEAVFSATSFTDFLNRAENFSALTEFDREMLESYRAIYDLVQASKIRVMEEKKELAVLTEKYEAKINEINALYELTAEEVEKYTAQITQEQGEQAYILAELRQKEQQINILTARVAAEIAAAEAEARAREAAQAQQAEAAGGGETAADTAAESGAAQESSAASTGEETAQAEASTTQSASDASSAQTTTAAAESSSDIGTGWDGPVLTKRAGTITGPSGKETYYNLNMSGVVKIMRNMGIVDEYWVRDDGVKMYGDYVMVAANLDVHPRGSIVDSSLGKAIVCDTGGFAYSNPNQLDIAVAW